MYFFTFTFLYLQVHRYICFGPLKHHHQGIQNYVQSTPICIPSAITISLVNLYVGFNQVLKPTYRLTKLFLIADGMHMGVD
jgi:hypothetical protein